MFSQGQRVALQVNPQQTGTVTLQTASRSGGQLYSVQWDGDHRTSVEAEADLAPAPATLTAWDRLGRNDLAPYTMFGIAGTVHKVWNTAANTISSLRASKTDFKPYQYVPLVKFLQSDS